ncbi:MAG TPA: 4-hydroxy-tetrahydrodipicolinate reductase [Actinomycetota bacterium]
MIRVGVVGAAGRMGREVCRAVAADPDIELVAAVDPHGADSTVEGLAIHPSLDALVDAQAQVAVDFTQPEVVMDSIRWATEHGVHYVVGTTGISPADLDEVRRLTERGHTNVIVAPNFAIGAVLMMRFAELAALSMSAAEVIELHHDGKLDAPSGTALGTARAIAAARGDVSPAPGGDDDHPGARGADVDGVRVHSVRLPGLLAHQEVIFGAPGQILSIRHDTTDRSAFMPGVLLAVKAVSSRPGLTVGLGALLEDA